MGLAKSSLTILPGVAVTLVFAVLTFFRLPSLESMDRYLYDVGTRLTRTGEGGRAPVVLVEIDEKSIQTLGQWPWPRHRLAEMIHLLGSQGAKVVGLDLPFRDRAAVHGLNEVRAFRERFDSFSFSKKDDGLRTWVLENLKGLEQNLDSDRKLAESVKRAGNGVLAAFPRAGRETMEPITGREGPLSRNFLADGGLSASLRERSTVLNLMVPFPEILEASQGLGHVCMSFEKGMEGRAHPLFIHHGGGLLPSFPLRVAMVYLGVEPGQGSVEDSRVRIRDILVPLSGGEMLIDFGTPPGVFARYSFADVMKAGKAPPEVKDKIVLIGLDLDETSGIETPVASRMSRTEFHAHILANILGKTCIRRPAAMPYVEIVMVLMVGALGLFLFPRLGRLTRLGVVVGLSALLCLVAVALFSRGLWLHVGYAVACGWVGYLVLSWVQGQAPGGTTKESVESNRLLGLSFQSQGLLDLAFEKFRKLPLDQETKDLIYNLGMEYERRRMINKALSAYEFIQKGGSYRDLADRIPKLKESDRSSTLGSHAVLSEAAGSGGASDGEARTGVGRYEIIQELGKGSMGLVYKALDPKINRLLAIKTIRFSDEFDEDVIHEIKARFFREAEIAGRLSHPSIVIIYDVGEDRELTYMAMEFLEGHDLEKFITKRNLMPLGKVLDVVGYVADALDYAHKAGVIHRDIKPANIMLLNSGGVKVTDFGIAKAISSSRTKTGVILGTPNYMSPEQIMGQKIDQRSDIFSLGVLFYQLLTGELPFHGENLSSLLYQITQVKPVSVRSHDPRIPRACEQIIEKALAKNPQDRFKNAGEMSRLVKLVRSKLDQMRKK